MNNGTITVGSSTSNTPTWLEEAQKKGHQPDFLSFTRKEIIAKGIIPEAEIGEGYMWQGEEHFSATEVCNREVAIIATWAPEKPLPVIEDVNIVMTHLRVMAMQQFTLPHPRMYFRTPVKPNVLMIFALLNNQQDGEIRMLRMNRKTVLDYFQRLTPMWVVGNHNLHKVADYVACHKARAVMFSVIALLYPELKLDRSESWKRLAMFTHRPDLMSMNELSPFMQMQVRAAQRRQNPPGEDQLAS